MREFKDSVTGHTTPTPEQPHHLPPAQTTATPTPAPEHERETV
jgi:hypothetical protein